MFIRETHVEMRARKMIDNIYTLHELLDAILFGDVAANRFQTWMRSLMFQQVQVEVERTNVISMFELAIQVAPNEAACPGDENSHA
jgi:hypothetical protein